ncbi:MAG: hypothetical protein H0U36_05935 [Nocardioidaceae bacterium]|nr:hypothetical protein [Nocardioidaceae bacterium]
MRSNGLTASSYSPVADLDPRVADAFLLELKQQGVAAYTRPVESTSMSGFDRPEIREGVLDRLYVDATEFEQVRGQLTAQDPSLAASSDDLTWAQIVAGFDKPVTGAVNPWPANEDLDFSPAGDAARDETPSPEPAGGPDFPADLKGWLAQRDATSPAYDRVDEESQNRSPARPDDADRFVPPTPPPLPKLEPYKQLAWVAVLGGPLLLLVGVLFSLALPAWLSVLAVGGFVGGFVTLIATMDDGDDEWTSGNGAVV